MQEGRVLQHHLIFRESLAIARTRADTSQQSLVILPGNGLSCKL